MVNFSLLPDPVQLGVIAPNNAPIVTTLQDIFAGLGKPLRTVTFESITDYQTSLNRFYKKETTEFTPAAFVLGNDYTSTSGGQIDFKYDLVMDSKQSSMLVPVLLNLGERLKQRLLDRNNYAEFFPLNTFYASQGVYIDISSTLVPPFLAYGSVL
jgi:hypothetical protein